MVLFLICFQPFTAYTKRANDLHNLWPFITTVLVGGFLLSLGAPNRRFLIPTFLLGTLFVANALLIVKDSIAGTDHNLFPIEFIFITLLTLPAYLGAVLAAAVDWFRAYKPTPSTRIR